MRQMLMMAAIVVAIAVAGARMADQVGHNARPPDAAAAAVAATTAAGLPPPQYVNDGHSVLVHRNSRGHFAVDARVDGHYMRFLIDTGATAVALTARDAAMLGFHPGAGDFTVQVNTANGSTRAAPTYLRTVEVDNLNVRNVTALVSANDSLSENLLGMSFLSRLKHVDMRGDMMVLEQ